ncbi:type II toxin-antitoxin system VapC family toxin [Methylobacterium aquaticum]|uniref:type II toxin-antitoxin system VapC family toxin n=1 Tax=Methylobacterium aquaticum TaxID=270351 RepID=UPI003D16D7CE
MPDAADPVLDASAVLAVIFGEDGADQVAGHLPGARISSVNAAEVMTKLIDLGMPEDTVDAIVEGLQLTIVPFEITHARECARLRTLTRSAGLSLGDRACLAVAKQLDAHAFTTDQAWSRLDSAAVGVTIELLR